MKQTNKISLIVGIIIIAIVSGIIVFQYQQKTADQTKIVNIVSNEISLGSILANVYPSLQGSPSEYSLPIKDIEMLSIVVDNPQIIKDWYIGGNFYLVTKNSKLEEIDRRSLGDQFVWGLSSGMRNFGLSHYHVPNAIEEHVPIYKITLQTLEKDTILENYYRIDDGKIFIEKNLPNDS